MRLHHWIASLAVVAVTAAPAFAQDNHDRRDNRGRSQQPQQTQQTEQQRREQPQARQQPAPQARQNERAVPRAVEPQREQAQRRDDQGRREDVQRQNNQAWRGDVQRQNGDVQRQNNEAWRGDVRRNDGQAWRGDVRRNDGQVRRDEQVRRDVAVPRAYSNRGIVVGRNDVRRWDGGRFGEPLHYGYGYSRIIRPTIIQVVPYRPYVYRPSWSIGVYYGYGDYYPYGYTPNGYFDPIPGRYYGGLRITGAPRDARVFADGYFVGIVDDFDGIFQHMNLEAGPHHVEIQWGAAQPVAFDVNVRPGETITFRADPSMFEPY